MEQFPKIFVLHVKTGYEDRARHIEKMMAKLGLPFEYVLDGDMGDLTQEGMDRFFAPPMNTVSAATSCGMKHLLAYERIENECPDGAIVLEDDIFLNRRFLKILPRSIRQAREFSQGRPFWIGYEATCLKFIPRSRRKKGSWFIRPMRFSVPELIMSLRSAPSCSGGLRRSRNVPCLTIGSSLPSIGREDSIFIGRIR